MQTLQVTTWKNEVPFAVAIEIDNTKTEAEIDAKIDQLFDTTRTWVNAQSAIDMVKRKD